MCGIIGIFGTDNAANMAALGLFAEQHRGQESCGMAVSDGLVIRLRKKMGLVKEVFSDDRLSELPGTIAIGHVRYPTKGSATEFNTQPHLVETLAGPTYALASNGDLVNYASIRKHLEAQNVYFKSDNDGELLVKYLAYRIIHHGDEISEAIRNLMKEVKGAYSCVLCTRTELYMFRDPLSIRPMVWGIAPDGAVVVASESCSLDTLDVVDRHEVPPAGIIRISKGQGNRDAGTTLERCNDILVIENDPNLYRNSGTEKHCIFEHIYFSRPDSHHFGEDVYRVRESIGAILAKNDEGLNPDLIVPVPDSSNFIGLGYATASKVPLSLGLIRNHYIGRTFIKPEQTIRDESVRQKFNVLPNFFKDKKIVLVDDSIVRGTTIRKIVKLIKNAGAAEIHLRIGSPQVCHSCYYGIDTPDAGELVANCFSLEEIRSKIGVDSLKHINIGDLRSCVQKPDNYCDACFTGDYPLGEPT
ncbi:MAG: amidophosphoribosyltransferase [Candidatus Cloacimonetes bacterium HGW-Cloacimonetes-3]|jgi:amidophosphoribosyltransferase|nr:MAG: amidophosphoribosyltransferase [Candidatus Cloacimonetes bacterium HGW-Cloacimonetes-3]